MEKTDKVMAVSGKAKNVFKFISLVAQYKGEKQLKDIK